jgi:predicted nucleotidyltransferase component of viral defense system
VSAARAGTNRAASVHARLLARAKERGEDFNLVLTRYAVERFLYRLSISTAREQFLLKGALLFDLWFDVPHRPTRDADFLGPGQSDATALAETIRSVCALDIDDGMSYDSSTMAIEEIREETNYGGLRVKLLAFLGNARSSLQLDVGYGDAVTPGPMDADYPTLLDDFPAPKLRVYPRETVAAEKLEAIVGLGIANSRMKDYFDLRALAREGALDARVLVTAIAATFQRRGTALRAAVPLGLTEAFATDPQKRAQWKGFLARNRIEAPSLDEVVAEVRAAFEMPLLDAGKAAKRS